MYLLRLLADASDDAAADAFDADLQATFTHHKDAWPHYL